VPDRRAALRAARRRPRGADTRGDDHQSPP
jgi:hypothetical protein